jgi:HAD superfamily hydrolase (TIGR01509 family)
VVSTGSTAGDLDELDRRLAAVLWDMDGTLVDTEPYWFDVESGLVEAWGGTWSRDDAKQLVGNDLLFSARYVRDRTGVDLAPEQIATMLVDGVVEKVEDSVPWRPGALELLDALRGAGVPCALVTSSYERFVTQVLRQLPEGTFSAVVAGDAVSNGKPHPEPYLRAARDLEVAPARCVAIEDSDAGATSAERAGCRVVVVENHVEVPRTGSRTFLPSLEGVGVEDLARLVRS